MYNADIAYRIDLSFFLLHRNSEVETYRILFLLLLSKRKTSKKDIISTDYVYIVDVAMLSLMVGLVYLYKFNSICSFACISVSDIHKKILDNVILFTS